MRAQIKNYKEEWTMDSFKEYLLGEMVAEELITDEEADDLRSDDFDMDSLIGSTDVDEYDLQNYAEAYSKACSENGVTPNWDLDGFVAA